MAENELWIGILGRVHFQTFRLFIYLIVIALQGAFAEHKSALKRLSFINIKLEIVLVRTPEDLSRCDALIIPGGGMSSNLFLFLSFISCRKYHDSTVSPTFGYT
jgi:imidazoleglycerol phosphate synthase glutamine amidotransferase subunit HisH